MLTSKVKDFYYEILIKKRQKFMENIRNIVQDFKIREQ